MTAVLTLLILAGFGYAIHHYAPRTEARALRLDRFRPRGTFADGHASHYDEQRRYSDLAAIHGRFEAPDAAPAAERAARPLLAPANPSCGTVRASFS